MDNESKSNKKDSPQNEPVEKAGGMTAAEKYLAHLCERSFLSLWSYPGVYRDQGKLGENGHGKEVCDLLVVFDQHVIIFSDKHCVLQVSGNEQRDWSRWFKKAVQKSAEQAWGAERWIRQNPNRLFLDRECKRPLPIDLPLLRLLKHGLGTEWECVGLPGGGKSRNERGQTTFSPRLSKNLGGRRCRQTI